MSLAEERSILAKLASLEVENTDMLSALHTAWLELDKMRAALRRLSEHPDEQVATIAKAGMA